MGVIFPGDRDDGEKQRYPRHPRFGTQDQLAAIDNVANRTRRQGKQNVRQSGCGLNERHIHRPSSKRQHQPGRTHHLHECADVTNDISKQQITEYGYAQGSPQARFYTRVMAGNAQDLPFQKE